MLAPGDRQRYARQILLREIGPAGQERLLGATLPARGRGPALEAAVELLCAAGVKVAERAGDGPWIGGLSLGAAAFADERLGCADCRARLLATEPAAPERAAVAQSVGAAAAAELLLSILDAGRAPLAMCFLSTPRRVSLECRCLP